MQRAFRVFLITAAGALTLPGATARGAVSAVPAARPAASYEVHGVLASFDPQTRQAVISHDAIPGYMEAMTMGFAVRDDATMRGLRPGDTLVFRLCVTADRAWIENVRKTGSGPVPLLAPAAARPVRALAVGDLLPDLALVNQSGENIRLSDFRGKALALTFIYTRCPLPTYCPLMSRNFQTAQALLDRLAAGDNWHFLSISMDPQHDGPAVLADYARSWQADARRWTFATADAAALRTLGGGVGLEFQRTNGVIYHNLRTVVVDPAGRIRRIFRGNAWTPQELAAEMRSAMRGRL